MSRVLVWKCDHDGKLFEDEKKYKAHLRKLARERAEARKEEKRLRDREQFLIDMGKNVKTIAELEKFIEDNSEWFYRNGLRESSWKMGRSVGPHKLKVSIQGARWSDSVSNSHRCPRNGETNWGGMKKGVPRGYPGWTARIIIDATPPAKSVGGVHSVPAEDGFGSDYFSNTIINTGSGGGGGNRNGAFHYEYSLELFASDFPAMAAIRDEHVGKRNTWNAVSPNKLPKHELPEYQ